MEISEFINHAEEIYAEIPHTSLECSNFGEIRYTGSNKYFGQITYFEDLPEILAGRIGVWDRDSVVMTSDPRTFFEKRTRQDRENEAALHFGLAA